MNDEEHEKLVEVGNSFYDKLGRMAAEHIAQMPQHLESETVAYLQDMCSIYGTQYDLYVQSLRELEIPALSETKLISE